MWYTSIQKINHHSRGREETSEAPPHHRAEAAQPTSRSRGMARSVSVRGCSSASASCGSPRRSASAAASETARRDSMWPTDWSRSSSERQYSKEAALF